MAAKLAKNPTDRGKAGSKVHLLVDERGAPLAIFITGANEHDKWSADDLIVHIVAKHPNSEQHFVQTKATITKMFINLSDYKTILSTSSIVVDAMNRKKNALYLARRVFQPDVGSSEELFRGWQKGVASLLAGVKSLITGFGLRYRLVGGMRERYFIGNRFKPRKLPENAQTPRARQDGSQENCRPRGCGTHEL